MGSRLAEAVDLYLARQALTKRPDGHWDRAGRWYPSDDEWSQCCASIRPPSRAYPYSLLKHCTTATHIARRLCVDERELRRAARARRAGKEV